MDSKLDSRTLRLFLILFIFGTMLVPKAAQAGNYWSVGSMVGLCAGTQIRSGPGYGFGAHTSVPENNWAVKVINGPRYADGQTWWDTSRKAAGDPNGGTGWVSQSDADRCNSAPPPAPPPPSQPQPPPPPAPPVAPPVVIPPFSCSTFSIGFAPLPTIRIKEVHARYIYFYEDISGEVKPGLYCPSLVSFHLSGKELEIGLPGGNVRFDGKMRPTGVGITPVRGVTYKNGTEAWPPGYWEAVEVDSTFYREQESKPILKFESSAEDRIGVRMKQEQVQYDLNWARLQAIAMASDAVQFINQVATELNKNAWLIAVIGMIAIYFKLPLPAPAYGAALPPVSSAESTADPEILDVLRRSYGTVVDNMTVRPMDVMQARVLASDPTQVVFEGVSAASTEMANTLPAVSYSASGFDANESVMVTMEKAGIARTAVTLNASAAGTVSGSFVLSDTDVLQGGTLTVLSAPTDEIQSNYDALANPSAQLHLSAAAAVVTVAAAPRLSSDVSFEPWPIVAGQPTTVTFTLRNTGDTPLPVNHTLLAVRGPDCPNWCDDRNQDWPSSGPITIPARGTYTYRMRDVLPQPGSYQAVPVYQDVSGGWHDAEASSRFTLPVQEGLRLVAALTLSPPDPQAGEEVTFRYAFRNESSTTIFVESTFASGRGPNCTNGWECASGADAPPVQSLTLPPGYSYVYEQKRVMTEPGTFFIQPYVRYRTDYWELLGTRIDYRVLPGIEMAAPIVLTPPQPVVGQPVQASFRLRNAGSRTITLRYLSADARGPNCEGSDWRCTNYAGWPWLGNITIQPGSEYTYRSSRSFDAAGGGYWVEPQIADINPWWQKAAGGQRLPFAVELGIGLAEPFTLTPPDPVAGQLVTTRFVLRNNSSQPLTLNRVLVGAQGPNCTDFACTMDRPEAWGDFHPVYALTFNPGESYTYQSQRLWLTPGANYVAQPLYQYGLTDWGGWGEINRFTVSKGLSVVEPLRITPASPEPGKPYTVTYALRNDSARALTIPAVAVGGSNVGCNDASCQNNAGMVAYQNVRIPANGRYDYVAVRTLAPPGAYYIDPMLIMAPPDWWMSFGQIANGGRITFTVGSALPPANTQPPCTVSIRNGATWTNNRSIQISLNVPGADRMFVSNDGGFLNPRDVAYAPTFDLLLSDVGMRIATQSVYVRAYQAGKELCNGTIFDDIVYDPLPPSVTATLLTATQAAAVPLDDNWGAELLPESMPGFMQDQAMSVLRIQAWDQEGGGGVSWMQVGTDPLLIETPWEPYQPEKRIATPAAGVVFVRVRDRAENLSNIVAAGDVSGSHFQWLPLVEQ